MAIPAMGTTHADYFHGAIPCTRLMNAGEIGGEYEKETGTVIIEAFRELNPDTGNISALLLDKHFFRKHGANAYYGQEK